MTDYPTAENITKISDTRYHIEYDSNAAVVIGSSDGDKFEPRASIRRWGGECWLEVFYEGNYTTKTKTEEKDGVDITALELEDNEGERKIRCNAIDGKEGADKGGFEYDIVLLSKPTTNKFVMKYRDSGNLRFLFQAPYSEINLSGEDIAAGVVTRDDTGGWDKDGNKVVNVPDWAHKSYAVYQEGHNPLYKNSTDAEKYAGGKLLHIHRPKIIDDRGKWVWGDIDIDTVNKTMTVTAPQSFLDTAKYPVRVDPTFGYTTLGSGSIGLIGFLVGRKASPGETGTASTLHVGLNADWGSGDRVKMALYENSTGDLVSPQCTERTDGHSSTAFEIFNFTASGPSLTNQDYIIAAWAGESCQIQRDTGSSGDSRWISYPYGTWPDPGSFSDTSYLYSTYCTYTTGAGVPTITSWENATGEIAYHYPDKRDLTIVGTNFEASQGTGVVKIGDASTFTACSEFDTLSVDSWSDTSIQVDIPSTLNNTLGNLWLYVTNDSGETNASGFACNINYMWGQRYAESQSTLVNWTRVMSGDSPPTSGMKLKRVWIYVGATHTSQVRLAVYQGAFAPASGPPSATLIEDLGLTSGSATNQWISVDSSTNPSLTADEDTWIAFKGNDSGFSMAYDGTTYPGGDDFYSARGRFLSVSVSSDETVAYPSTWPSDTGTFDNYWYSVYLEYEGVGYPAITAFGGNRHEFNATAIDVDGSNFGTSETGPAKVELGDAATYAGCTIKVSQDVNSWGPSQVDIDIIRGTLPGGRAWLYVTNSTGNYNSNGYPCLIGTFAFQVFVTPGTDTFSVPKGITKLYSKKWGAAGGGGGAAGTGDGPGGDGGAGAFVELDLTVTAEETLNLSIGGGGDFGEGYTTYSGGGGAGGGLTGVFRGAIATRANALGIAGSGGGGGAGDNSSTTPGGDGGPGGGSTGVSGGDSSTATGGGGGTQSAGGAAGTGGGNGEAGETDGTYHGGDGGFNGGTSGAAGGTGGTQYGGDGGDEDVAGYGGGGGGGSGLYGGGGGGSSVASDAGGGGGGGGSSKTSGVVIYNLQGSGVTPPKSDDLDYNASYGGGGTGGAVPGGDGTAGEGGRIVLLWLVWGNEIHGVDAGNDSGDTDEIHGIEDSEIDELHNMVA